MLQKIKTIKKNYIMKKLFFLCTMLAGVAASAQTLSIKITQIDYSTQIATCDLSWTGCNDRHRSDVWVFADYIEISGNTTTGNWKPAAITGATVTKNTIGNATVSTVSGNTRGVWVKSVSSGANFTGQVALQLTGVPAKFNACAYATDFPPNATNQNGTYTLKGTPPFIINGSATVTGRTYSGGTITTLTDATQCPGGVPRDAAHDGADCAPNLTSVGSYCRDLVADDARSVPCSGSQIETRNNHDGSGTWTAAPCPSGWRLPTSNEAVCIWDNAADKTTLQLGWTTTAYSTRYYSFRGCCCGVTPCATSLGGWVSRLREFSVYAAYQDPGCAPNCYMWYVIGDLPVSTPLPYFCIR
jgi:autotransporter translocation and assembly factor TamB